MQEVHSRTDYIFWILIFLAGMLLIITLFSLGISDVFATPFPVNTSPIIFTPTQITIASGGMSVLDIDQDGYVDCIYNLSGTTLTREFGSTTLCKSSITTEGALGAGGAVWLGKPYKDRLMVITTKGDTATACGARNLQYRAGDGLKVSSITDNGASLVADLQPTGMILTTNKSFTKIVCAGGGIPGRLLSNQAGIPNDTSIFSGSPPQNTMNFIGWTDGPNYILMYNTTKKPGSAPTSNDELIVYNKDTNDFNTITAGLYFNIFPAQYYTDPAVQYYREGLLVPTKMNVKLTTSLMEPELAPINIDSVETILPSLDLSGTNANFVLTNTRMLMKNNTELFLGTLSGNSVYYVSYNSTLQAELTNRAYALYRTDFSDAFDTHLFQTGTGTAQTMLLVRPDLTTISQSIRTQELLPSGYGIKTSATQSRFYKTEWIKDTDTFLPIKTNAGSPTELTLEIKNAFPDTAIRIRDAVLYQDTTPFIWLVDELQTDNTITFSLLPNQCVYVDIKNIGIENAQWIYIGFMCHNGLTYKILPNTSELSYTFWAFPLGANHIFNQTSNELQTQVRSETTPFNYNIRVYDKTGTLFIDQDFNSNTTTSLAAFDTTGINLPARLIINNLDNENQTIYNANLGFANFLSGIAVFINTYLTYEGFNILVFMPLIFAAMFTRNTVGIGTVLTVVFIATMVWTGLISIPDVILYAMFIIAAIGLIAYKTVY